MKKARREFLKRSGCGILGASLLSAASPWLEGCASIDHWVTGEGRDDGQMVTIIGGGLTGLAAAFELKKNKIPYRLFEGSQRAGGRVFTLNEVNVSNTGAELGAERITSDYQALLGLARELRVPFEENEVPEEFLFFEKGTAGLKKNLVEDLNRIRNILRQVGLEAYSNSTQILNYQNIGQFPKAEVLDHMSAADFFQRLNLQLSPFQKTFLTQLIRTEWGVDPSEISALHLVHWSRDDFKSKQRKLVRLIGGNSTLVQALLDRVYGIIPDRFVKFEHRLISIRMSDEGWVLGFRVRGAYQEILSHRIICTLPMAQLRQVDGWQSLPMTQVQKDYIDNLGYSASSKVLLSFEGRNWGHAKKLEQGGILLSDLASVRFTEAMGSGGRGLGLAHGLLQIQVGGSLAEQVGLHTIPEMLELTDRIFSKNLKFDGVARVQNWKRAPWASGAKYFFKPGQFQKFSNSEDLDFENQAYPFLLAGDAFNLPFHGTMNGAVISGTQAARKFVSKMG